jgi:hypothetical protein
MSDDEITLRKARPIFEGAGAMLGTVGVTSQLVESVGYTPGTKGALAILTVGGPALAAAALRKRAPNIAKGLLAGAAVNATRWLLSPPALTTHPACVPTIYGEGGGLARQIERSLPLLTLIRPGGVQVHGNYADLTRNIHRYANTLRTAMPSVEVWAAVTGDEYHDRVTSGAVSLSDLRRIRIDAMKAAQDAGCAVWVWDCEALWKRGDRGFNAPAAQQMIADGREHAPGLRQWLTSYFAPVHVEWSDPNGAHHSGGGHEDFPWRGFLAVDGYAPQIYYAAREGAWADALFVRSWATAQQRGLVRADAELCAYIRVHGMPVDESTRTCNILPSAAFWYLFDRGLDTSGKVTIAAMQRLHDAGFVGPGRIEAFQREHHLAITGYVDQATAGALGVR